MRIISRRTLREFWERRGYADAEQALKSWFREALNGDWATPAEIKAAFGTASIVGNNRVVFNIGGNKYRVISSIHFNRQMLFVRHVFTHKEYDKWKP